MRPETRILGACAVLAVTAFLSVSVVGGGFDNDSRVAVRLRGDSMTRITALCRATAGWLNRRNSRSVAFRDSAGDPPSSLPR